MFQRRHWLLLPSGVAPFLLQHAREGGCPLLRVLRALATMEGSGPLVEVLRR